MSEPMKCKYCGMPLDGPRVQLQYCNGCDLELEQQSISAIVAAMPIEQVRKELQARGIDTANAFNRVKAAVRKVKGARSDGQQND